MKTLCLSALFCTFFLGACGSEDETQATTDSPQSTACENVDILFVVDNSGSMADNQAALVQSYPGFIKGIQNQLGADKNYHVGVATSDEYAGNATGCQQIGALVTQTSGPNSSESVCGPFSEGHRFLSAKDDLSGGFACMATVGTGGDGNENVMEAAIAAVGPGLNQSGGCNAGFIRDDSLLVVVIIADEDDEDFGDTVTGGAKSFGGDVAEALGFDREKGEALGVRTIKEIGGEVAPDEEFIPADELADHWMKKLLKASGRDANRIVMVTVVKGAPDNQCGTSEELGTPATRLIEFTNQFKHKHVGDICASSYGGIMAAALEPVHTACEEFDLPSSSEGDLWGDDLTQPQCEGGCCIPTQWLDKVLLVLFPLLTLLFGGLMLSRIMERRAINLATNAYKGRHTGWNIAGLCSLAVFTATLFGLVGCFPVQLVSVVLVGGLFWGTHLIYLLMMNTKI